jgi:hypothetical protein
VHETGTAYSPSLTGPVGIDVAEKYWSVYAQPLDYGVSGTRRFFANQDGDVMASDNLVAQAAGSILVRPGADAFVGTGITGRTASGTVGNDGDLWKVADSPTLAAREEEAIRMLRTFVKAQQAIAASDLIDADGDGAGEFGTLFELSGSIPLRTGTVPGSDFLYFGASLQLPLIPRSFSLIYPLGDCIRDGYVFRLLLPGAGAGQAGFVHERGPLPAANLTAPVGVDRSEIYWCAYAQPLEYGVTGRRRFFVNQAGVITESANRVVRADGFFQNSQFADAFLGAGITSPAAVGTLGHDGEIWKPVD